MTWRSHAACLGSGIDFYAVPDDRHREVCGQCRVQVECLADSLPWDARDLRSTGACYGYRGCKSPKERTLILRASCRWCGVAGQGQECEPCRVWPYKQERRSALKSYRVAA